MNFKIEIASLPKAYNATIFSWTCLFRNEKFHLYLMCPIQIKHDFPALLSLT